MSRVKTMNSYKKDFMKECQQLEEELARLKETKAFDSPVLLPQNKNEDQKEEFEIYPDFKALEIPEKLKNEAEEIRKRSFDEINEEEQKEIIEEDHKIQLEEEEMEEQIFQEAKR